MDANAQKHLPVGQLADPMYWNCLRPIWSSWWKELQSSIGRNLDLMLALTSTLSSLSLG